MFFNCVSGDGTKLHFAESFDVDMELKVSIEQNSDELTVFLTKNELLILRNKLNKILGGK